MTCVPHDSFLTRVTDSRPNIKVRAANKGLMDVQSMGTYVGRATSYREVPDPAGSAKKPKRPRREPTVSTVTLTSVLAVAGLSKPLFSCESAFLHDGIRTELNDDRRLQLADGCYRSHQLRPLPVPGLTSGEKPWRLMWKGNLQTVLGYSKT